jgi:alkanesulfonate monooxygenase SsuD/methylene tetrahydromethanopterin reductase-like flavin-dependent oxidoreductase (luciferase family)
VPVNDPLLLIPAMAYVTRNLGFGVTCAVSYEHPYILARRFSTLDHLTGGRIGWNIVTGYLNSAAKGMGLAQQPEHDTRYEIAEEYMQIVYKLWEGSWEDEAVLRDRARRVFARPEKVYRIQHDGRHFQIDAIHLCEPSPQRTPLIYQAGASSRGRQFAATHAECVFINGAPTPAVIPVASAPQNVTRIMLGVTLAPPARAARAPKSARKTSEVPDTRIIRVPSGAKAETMRGMTAPTAKLPAGSLMVSPCCRGLNRTLLLQQPNQTDNRRNPKCGT